GYGDDHKVRYGPSKVHYQHAGNCCQEGQGDGADGEGSRGTKDIAVCRPLHWVGGEGN
ncbi:hypothetical protein EC988_010350, partial [Linderina pennispora]